VELLDAFGDEAGDAAGAFEAAVDDHGGGGAGDLAVVNPAAGRDDSGPSFGGGALPGPQRPDLKT
jgi:hypothetical protein